MRLVLSEDSLKNNVPIFFKTFTLPTCSCPSKSLAFTFCGQDLFRKKMNENSKQKGYLIVIYNQKL